jgi:Nucleotidyl transferase AbiEii toxin, Type IV TA system
LKEIASVVAGIDGLELQSEGQASRGVSRTVVLAYDPRTPMPGLSPTIVVEMGVRGGPHPLETRGLSSMLAEALAKPGIEDETLRSFEMVVLHPRRTFVEKLFAIHSACELHSEGRQTALVRQTRHLADIYSLLGDRDVAEFIGSGEYLDLLSEVDAISAEHFPRDHRAPAPLRFASSRALAPEGGLRAAIEADYARSEVLFYGERPDLAAIYERIAEFADRL